MKVAAAWTLLRRQLVGDWWMAREPDGAVMIAQRRIDVDDLDGRAHALMRAAGEPSRRWRPAVWLGAAGLALGAVGAALSPGPLELRQGSRIENPLGVAGGASDALSLVGTLVQAIAVVLAAASIAVRLRGARGAERQQLKWFAYLALVLLIGLAVGRSGLAVAASTLAVAALFQPARARIQAAVDRHFFRRRYDAQQTLEAFAGRLRDQIDLAALSAELRGVTQQTMEPAHLSLCLRGER